MSKFEEITKKVNHLSKILENTNEPKILWEEMKILSGKAFDLQDEINDALTKLEETETDLIKLQSVFDTREMVWDMIAKIAIREMEVKEKATKGRKNATEKKPAKREKCCCGHTHDDKHDCCPSDKQDCECHGDDCSGCCHHKN
ncbi:MAG: hypothetical protein IKY98_01225 [Alphaproteobacteria bacterium]|nr:hypothetical protein [Alphaproteobacteria bacterium]